MGCWGTVGLLHVDSRQSIHDVWSRLAGVPGVRP